MFFIKMLIALHKKEHNFVSSLEEYEVTQKEWLLFNA